MGLPIWEPGVKLGHRVRVVFCYVYFLLFLQYKKYGVSPGPVLPKVRWARLNGAECKNSKCEPAKVLATPGTALQEGRGWISKNPKIP